MSTLLQVGQAATQSAAFNLRVQAAVFKLAQDVINEDPETDGHPLRIGLADATIRNPQSVVGQFIWLCASNPAIAATVVDDAEGRVQVGAPDGDIEFVCSSYWSTVAGWRAQGNSL